MSGSLTRRARGALVVLFAVLAVVFVPGVAKAEIPEWAKGANILERSFREDFLNDEEHGQVYMFRLYNPYTGEHFYTSEKVEKDSLVEVGWRYECLGWIAPTKSDTPVYRLYNPWVEGGDHHYTTSKAERDACIEAGWTDEGIGWYSADEKSGEPLLRQYNPYAETGTHNYTTNQVENDALVEAGWKEEGIGWYGVKPTAPADLEAFEKYAYRGYLEPYEQALYSFLIDGYSLSESVGGLSLALETSPDFSDGFWLQSSEYYAFSILLKYGDEHGVEYNLYDMSDAEAVELLQKAGGATDAQLTVYLQQIGFSYELSVEGIECLHDEVSFDRG